MVGSPLLTWRRICARVAAPVCMFLAALVLLPAGAHANDSSFGGKGGDLRPMQSKNVVMEEELVQIWLRGSGYQVRSEYIFRNDGPAQKVAMGFPSTVAGPDSDGSELEQFIARVDGEDLESTLETVDDPTTGGSTRWHVHKVPFEAGQRRGVMTEYVQRYSSSVPPDGTGPMPNWIEYAFHTGASWKGRIDRIDVRIYKSDGYTFAHPFSLQDDPRTATSPERFTRKPWGWQLVMRDVEPTAKTDLHMTFLGQGAESGFDRVESPRPAAGTILDDPRLDEVPQDGVPQADEDYPSSGEPIVVTSDGGAATSDTEGATPPAPPTALPVSSAGDSGATIKNLALLAAGILLVLVGAVWVILSLRRKTNA